MPDLHIDMEEFGREMKRLGTAGTSLRRDLRKAVAESGSAITDAVKREASWSKGTPRPAYKNDKTTGRTSIPEATSLGMTFGAQSVGVVVKVNANKAPHGPGLEFGSKGSGGRTLRHPVFLKKGEKGAWAAQPTRPFFYAAIAATTPLVEGKIQNVIDVIAFGAGFKGR